MFEEIVGLKLNPALNTSVPLNIIISTFVPLYVTVSTVVPLNTKGMAVPSYVVEMVSVVPDSETFTPPRVEDVAAGSV